MHIPDQGESRVGSRAKSIWTVWKVLFLGGVIVGAQHVVSSFQLFRALEQWSLGVASVVAHPSQSGELVIVSITREDYVRDFNGKSPLRADRLKHLVQAVALGRPRVVGVDIDTSDRRFVGFEEDVRGDAGSIDDDAARFLRTVPIVWARVPTFSRVQKRYFLSPVLGERAPPADTAAAALPLDGNDIARYYSRAVATDLDVGPMPTFARSVFAQVNPIITPDNDTGLRLIHYPLPGAGGKRSINPMPAQTFLRQDLDTAWRIPSPVRDKIALIGGAYDPDDEHRTPIGWLAGVEIVAQIIDTELEGGGVRPPDPIRSAIVSWVVAVLFAYLLRYLLRRCLLWQLIMAGLTFSVLGSFALSYLVCSSLYQAPFFFLLLFLTWLYNMWPHLLSWWQKISQ